MPVRGHRRGRSTKCPAKQHIGLAGAAATVVATGRANDEIVEAVAIDVSGRRNAAARKVIGRITLDLEALRPGECAEVYHLASADVADVEGLRAEQHIGLAGLTATVITPRCADDHIIEAVAIEVAGRRNAYAGIGLPSRPLERRNLATG